MTKFIAEACEHGLMVVLHDDNHVETIVFSLSGGEWVEREVDQFLQWHAENLNEAGWMLVNHASWKFNDDRPHPYYTADVMRIEHDGKFCGCAPGEHNRNDLEDVPLQSKLLVDGPLGRQELIADGQFFVRAPLGDSTGCDGCERTDVRLYNFTWYTEGGEYNLTLCEPCSQNPDGME